MNVGDPKGLFLIFMSLYNFDSHLVTSMVTAACDKWLTSDRERFKITGVETRREMSLDVPSVDTPPEDLRRVTGVIDIEGVERSQGIPFIIDWKTRNGKFDTIWRNRLRDSWQWRIYTAGTYVPYCIYRGVSYDGECTEIIMEAPPSNQEEVTAYLEMSWRQRETYCDQTAWTRNMPRACNTWGRVCPFLEDCRKFERIPKKLIDIRRSISYIGLELFHLCPERYRRTELEGKGEDTEESDIGTEFHLRIAEVYKREFL